MLPVKQEGGLVYGIQYYAKATGKPLFTRLAVIAIRVTVCCWMTLKCSAEPKRRDVAQIAIFAAESEPLWRRNKMYPKGQESDFQYRAA